MMMRYPAKHSVRRSNRAGMFFLMRNSGQEALSIVHSRKIDLMIIDISMPEKSGYELLDMIKENSVQ